MDLRANVQAPVRPHTPKRVPVSELTAPLLGLLIGDLTSRPLFVDGPARITRSGAFAIPRAAAGTNLHALRSGH